MILKKTSLCFQRPFIRSSTVQGSPSHVYTQNSMMAWQPPWMGLQGVSLAPMYPRLPPSLLSVSINISTFPCFSFLFILAVETILSVLCRSSFTLYYRGFVVTFLSFQQPDIIDTKLSELSVDGVCQLFSKIPDINSNQVATYTALIRENNVNGRVLLHCDLDELKKVNPSAFSR